jgi:hypothetical protein
VAKVSGGVQMFVSVGGLFLSPYAVMNLAQLATANGRDNVI